MIDLNWIARIKNPLIRKTLMLTALPIGLFIVIPVALFVVFRAEMPEFMIYTKEAWHGDYAK